MSAICIFQLSNSGKNYITESETGEKIQKAVNIRHINVDTDPPDLRRMVADHDYLITKISIN
jgi:hypothetical protein